MRCAPEIENTHPFLDGCWILQHNHTLAPFDQARKELLAATSPSCHAKPTRSAGLPSSTAV